MPSRLPLLLLAALIAAARAQPSCMDARYWYQGSGDAAQSCCGKSDDEPLARPAFCDAVTFGTVHQERDPHQRAQKALKIHTLAKKMADSFLGDLRIPLTALRAGSNARTTPHEKKVSLREDGEMRSYFTEPLDVKTWFSAAFLVMGEIINRYLVGVPADVTVDPTQAEMMLGIAVSTEVAAAGAPDNYSAYQLWSKQYWQDTHNDVLVKNPAVGLSAFWPGNEYGFEAMKNAFRAGHFYMEQESYIAPTPDYYPDGADWSRASYLDGFFLYGRNRLIPFPDGNQVYVFGPFWKGLRHLKEFAGPFLDRMCDAGYNNAGPALDPDCEWLGLRMIRTTTNCPAVPYPSAPSGGGQDVEGICWETEPDPETNGTRYKLRDAIPEELYNADGVLDAFKVEEYVATVVFNNTHGARDNSGFSVMRTLSQYKSITDAEYHGTLGVMRQVQPSPLTPAQRAAAWPVASTTTWDDKPLAGLIVVALVKVVASVTAAEFLAKMGATVVVVQDPLEIKFRSFDAPLTYGCDIVNLDLRVAADRDSFEALLRKAHVFLTNLNPGSMARMQYSPEEVAALAPDRGMVYAQFTCAAPGQLDNAKCFADNAAQLSGVADSFLRFQNPTYKYVFTFFQDNFGGSSFIVSILAALARWRLSGGVWHVRSSLTQAGSFAAEHLDMQTPVDYVPRTAAGAPPLELDEYWHLTTRHVPKCGFPNNGSYATGASITDDRWDLEGSIDWDVKTLSSPFSTAAHEFLHFADVKWTTQAVLSNKPVAEVLAALPS